MNVNIVKKNSGDLAILQLNINEEIQAEPGILVGMTSGITMETHPRKGLLNGLRRLIMGSENFFINRYVSNEENGEIIIAPIEKGEIEEIAVEGEFYLQSKAFLASYGNVDADINWEDARLFYNNEEIFLLKVTGKGTVIFASDGGVYKKKLAEGEKYKVSSGHILAFTAELKYNFGITPGGLKEALFGASTLVTEFTGPGEIYIQTCGKRDKEDKVTENNLRS